MSANTKAKSGKAEAETNLSEDQRRQYMAILNFEWLKRHVR